MHRQREPLYGTARPVYAGKGSAAAGRRHHPNLNELVRAAHRAWRLDIVAAPTNVFLVFLSHLDIFYHCSLTLLKRDSHSAE